MIIKTSTRRMEIEQFDHWYNREELETFPAAVRKELLGHRSGLKGEAETAFHLDREFFTSGDHALIHDLRIPDVSGTYAQFDHVLLSRLSKTISIFETKNFSGRLSKNTHGEWMVWYQGQRRPVDIPNPVEQARRQQTVLERWLKNRKFDGLFTTIRCFVVVPAKCAIDRSKIRASEPIFKADNVYREWVEFGGISPIGKLFSTGVSSEALRKIATTLARSHEAPDTTIFHRLNVIPEEVMQQLEAERQAQEQSARQGADLEAIRDSQLQIDSSIMPPQSPLNGERL